MQQLTGSYMWHYVSDESKIEGLKEEHQYLACFEVDEPFGPVWKMRLVYWFEKGAKLTIYEKDGTPHDFKIEDDGFYIIDDIGGSKGPRCFKLRGVRYWTEIHEPGVNPDDTLTIVG